MTVNLSVHITAQSGFGEAKESEKAKLEGFEGGGGLPGERSTISKAVSLSL